jgi:RNA-binding protein NOB1
MQRIAASVDGKTGRLKLHLKKNYRQNLRGTKFSLPKAGSVRIQRWNCGTRFLT